MKLLRFITAASILCIQLHSESRTGGENNNPFIRSVPGSTSSNTPIIRPSDSGFFSSTSNIVEDNVGNGQNGLEYKMADANRQANAGAAAAFTSAGLLTGAAVAALLAMQYAEAGRLFGLAGMEFGQGGAAIATRDANGLNRSILMADGNQKSQQAFDRQAMANSLLDANARSALAAQGIDPNTFMNDLVSGKIRSGSDALTALGQNPTPEQAAAANDYSGVDVNGILSSDPESLGPEYRSLLGVKDDAMPQSTASGPSSAGMGAVSGVSSAPGSSKAASAGAGSGVGISASSAVPTKGANGSKSAPVGLAEHIGLNGLPNMAELFAVMNQGQEIDPAAMAVLREQLLSLGVSKTKGQNIFRLANRNFRSFSKWRGIRNQKNPTRGLASVRR